MQADVVIIGSGMGGATLAAKLAPSGRRIVILERGKRLLPSATDRDATAIFEHGVYRPNEEWLDGKDRPFNPGNYYCVGGNSKFYGAVLIRYREADFEPVAHAGGQTIGWPIPYSELEPDYLSAEHLYQVRGSVGEDPTEPKRSGAYLHSAVLDEPDIADLRKRLKTVGLCPASLPLGVDIDRWFAAGKTPWDAHPDTCGGKMDAETIGIKTALSYPNVELRTECEVTRLVTDPSGQVTAVEYREKQTNKTISAPLFALAAGAVQSAALLLKSASDAFPAGVANQSDQVGRNFMNHNCSAVLALHPLRRNRSIYQKTLMVNDFYLQDGSGRGPLGNIQLLGKISGPILTSGSRLPRWAAGWIADRSFDFYAMSEDLPNPDSRITIRNGKIRLDWQRSNWAAHENLVATLKSHLKRAGFPIVLSQAFDRKTPSHQCGTARMGQDAASSVVDTHCRAHDHHNLFIVDASVLPTSAAVNPALTVAALAIRAARHINTTEFGT